MQECRGSSWQYRQAALVDRGRQDILQTDGDQAQTECQKTELTVYALGFSLTLYQPVVLGYIMSDSLFSTTQSVIHAPQYIYITSAALTCSLWSTRVNWQTAYRGSEPMEEEGVCECVSSCPLQYHPSPSHWSKYIFITWSPAGTAFNHHALELYSVYIPLACRLHTLQELHVYCT